MDFSIRLTRAAAVMTWLSLVVGVAAATLMHELGPPQGVTVHLEAVYAWSAFGALVTIVLTALPRWSASSPAVLANLGPARIVLCLAIHVWVTALVAVTGGVRGPFWICYRGVVLFAAVSMPAWQSARSKRGFPTERIVRWGTASRVRWRSSTCQVGARSSA